MARGIAHDLNNILTAINLNIESVMKDYLTQKEQKEVLQESQETSLRAKEQSKRLLAFSKGGNSDP
ncbi:MAG: histidine kinase dimerization/phospho-acceptor domain-containing protein [Verrucomicrobiota bacterium]